MTFQAKKFPGTYYTNTQHAILKCLICIVDLWVLSSLRLGVEGVIEMHLAIMFQVTNPTYGAMVLLQYQALLGLGKDLGIVGYGEGPSQSRPPGVSRPPHLAGLQQKHEGVFGCLNFLTVLPVVGGFAFARCPSFS